MRVKEKARARHMLHMGLWIDEVVAAFGGLYSQEEILRGVDEIRARERVYCGLPKATREICATLGKGEPPDPETLRERDERLARYDLRDLTARLLGDPPPRPTSNTGGESGAEDRSLFVPLAPVIHNGEDDINFWKRMDSRLRWIRSLERRDEGVHGLEP